MGKSERAKERKKDSRAQQALAKVNEFTCSMLANNMVTLQKLAKKRGASEIARVLEKGFVSSFFVCLFD